MAKKSSNNMVYNEDARNVMDFLDDSVRVKSTITSPPYFDMKDYGSKNQIGFGQTYEAYLNDLQEIFNKIYTITDEDGSLWIIIDSFKRDSQVVTLPFDLSNKLKDTGWLLQDIIIWKKDKTVPWSNSGFVQRKFEYILFFTKTSNFKYNKDRVRNYDTDQLKKWWVKYPERYNPKGKALDEIWEFAIPVQGSWGDKYIRHFCPLPKEMVATMIEISTDEGDIVFDPFAGSGSVLFQSAVMNRSYIGFELNSEFIGMFQDYLKKNIKSSKKEYIQLQHLGSQDEFKQKILELRALKYGRLLINALEKELKLDLKLSVEILEYLTGGRAHIKVEYKIISTSNDPQILLNMANEIVKKPPLSKFGIVPCFEVVDSFDLERGIYYGYTKTNTYSFSNAPIMSPIIKVISTICVNLNERDYN